MLSSAEHDISNAHKYKKIKMDIFSGSNKPRMLFFLLIKVEMPTIVGILTFMSRKKFMLSLAWIFFKASGSDSTEILPKRT